MLQGDAHFVGQAHSDDVVNEGALGISSAPAVTASAGIIRADRTCDPALNPCARR